MALGWATEDDDGDSAGAGTSKTIKKASKVDFKQVREHLSEIDSIQELNSYWRELRLTKKQEDILKPDFAKRKAIIEGEA